MNKTIYQILKTTFTGILVGLLIVVFKYSTNLIIFLSDFFFLNEMLYIRIIGYFLIVLLSFVSYKFTRICGNIQGSGLPQLEINLKQDLNNINVKKALPLMFINSLISIFVGIPVAVGGSVAAYLGGMTGKIANRIMNKFGKFDDGNVVCAAGAGVSSSLGSPTGGVFYSYEECEKELQKKRFLYSIYMSLIAYLISYSIGPGFYKMFRVTNPFSLKYFSVIAFIVMTNIILSFLIMYLVPRIKKFINKNYKKAIFKYRLFVVFAITLVIMIFIPIVGGPGLSIFNLMFETTDTYLLIIYLLIRIILLIIVSNSTISGGQILPEIAIGVLVALIFCNLFSVPMESRVLLCLVSSIGFVGAVNKTPLAALFIGISFAGYKNIEYSFIPLVIGVLLTFVPIYFSKIDDVNDALLKLLKTSDHIKKRTSLKKQNYKHKKTRNVHKFREEPHYF